MKNIRMISIVAIMLASCNSKSGESNQNQDRSSASTETFKTVHQKLIDQYSNPMIPQDFHIETLVGLDNHFKNNSRHKPIHTVKMDRFSGVLLDRIPDRVLASLTKSAYQKTEPSVFMILNSTFWKQAGKLQKKGIQIGFLSPKSSSGLNGVYFPENKTILLSIFAAPGTLEHEYRHDTQSKLQVKLDRIKCEEYTIDSICISELKRFFGEIDSTTHEFESWIDTFPNINTDFEHESPINRIQTRFSPISPVIDIFEKNILYPVNENRDLNKGACSNEIKEMASKIKDRVDFVNRNGLSDLLTSLNTSIFRSQMIWESITDENRMDSYHEFQAESDSLKNTINELIKRESESRRSDLKNQIPVWFEKYHGELCDRIASYRLLADCEVKR